jgi:CHAT domain-containing protein
MKRLYISLWYSLKRIGFNILQKAGEKFKKIEIEGVQSYANRLVNFCLKRWGFFSMQPQRVGLTALATFLATFAIDGRLGNFYLAQGKPLNWQLIQNSQVFAQTPNPQKAQADKFFEQGNKQLDTSEFKGALQSFQQALNSYRAINNRTNEAQTLNKLGEVYRNLGQTQTALNHHEQALAIIRQSGERTQEATTLHNIASVYETQGQYENALKFYEQALLIQREVKDKAGEAATLIGLGNTYIAYIESKLRYQVIKKPEELKSYQEVLKYYEQALVMMREINNRAGEAWSLNGIGMTYNALGTKREKEDALKFYQQALSPQEQQIREGMTAELDKAIALGKELAQLESIAVTNRTPTQKQRILELRKTQQEVTKQFNAFLDSPKVREWIGQLQQTTQGQSFNLESSATALQDNLKKLQQDPVILYPFVLSDRLELVLVTPYAAPLRRTVAVKQEELNRVIAEFRSVVTKRTPNAKVPAQKLYDWLIKPLENDLAQAKAKTIIYAPDGQLRYIPLAALYDGQQWLVERFGINNITAVSLTDLNTKPQNQLNVLAAAFTQGNYSFQVGSQKFKFSGLPFAGVEVENLAQTVPRTKKLLDQQFNQDIVLQMNDFSVVHLATHAAFTNGQPEESFIVFGNGDRATLRDIKNWRLPNVDLVVLSACETGLGDNLGDGREILGFGYQMQQTGARAVIASLWSVDDGGTQALMNAFYSIMAQGKTTKAEALRQAQISLINGNYATIGQQRGSNSSLPPQVSNNLSHPFYWAPFILIGNGL